MSVRHEHDEPEGETTGCDPRDPLQHSETTQGFAADPDYWKGEVFAYVGSIQNLKDLKDPALTFGQPGTILGGESDATKTAWLYRKELHLLKVWMDFHDWRACPFDFSWIVLGAVGYFLSTFGDKRPGLPPKYGKRGRITGVPRP